MERLIRISITTGAALAVAASALVPGLAGASAQKDSGATAFAVRTPPPPPPVFGFTSRTADGDGTVALHLSCGPHSGSPFTPCDEDFIRFCAILGGNSDISEPEPGDPEPNGSCDVPHPETPEPHD